MITRIVVFVIYMMMLLGVGIYSYGKTKRESDYWIAGGKVGWAVGGATIASTQMSAGLFVGTIGMMYNVGWAFAWVVFAFPIAYWIMVGVIAPRFTKVKELTIPAFFERRYYSKLARGVSAIVLLVTMVVYIQAQVVAGGLIANILFGISEQRGMVYFSLLIIVYTFIGGMFAVVYNDFLNIMIMILGAAIALPVALSHIGGFSNLLVYVQATNPLTFTWKTMPPVLLFTLSLAFLLGSIASPERLIRLYVMKDMKTIRRGILFTMILVFLAHILVFFLALACRVFFPVLTKADMAMPMIAVGVLPLVSGTILLTAVLAAMLSSVDSLLLVAASALSHDIAGMFWKNLPEGKKVWIGRFGVIVVGIIPVLLLLTGMSAGVLVQLIVALFSALMGACFLSPVLLGILWKRTTKEGAIASMIGGLLGTFAWHIFGSPNISPVVPGVLISMALCVGVSLMTPSPPQSAINPYFGD